MGGHKTIRNDDKRIDGIQLQSSSYGGPVTLVYGTNRVPANLIWYGDFQAIPHTSTQSSGGKGGGARQETTKYTYQAAVAMAVSDGPIYGITRAWRDKDVYQMTSHPNIALNWVTLPAASMDGAIFGGNDGQSPWSYLTSKHPGQDLPYNRLAYVGAAPIALDESAALQNHNFEVMGNKIFDPSNIPDANPKDIVYDFLTDAYHGVPQWDASRLGDLTQYSNYCVANSLFLSPALTEQRAASEILQELVDSTNTLIVWSEGKLKFVPRGDAQVSAHGVTYTPNNTPVYDLNDDDYQVTGGQDPVRLMRKRPSDAYNRYPVEYANRANSYALDVVEAKDQGDIAVHGLRKADKKSLPMICDGNTAMAIAQILLQRSLYIRNTFEFDLDFRYSLLEPGDLVTLTDSKIGLAKTPVQILEMEETDDGYKVTAEEYPFGVNSHTLYPSQTGAGYAPDYNSAPPSINAPAIFDAPGCLTATGFEIWAAISGQGSNWGGADMWASFDGNTYQYVGSIHGAARHGVLSAALTTGSDPDTANTLSVDLTVSGGSLTSGTQADADADRTLCLVDGELVSFETATLTATSQYNLTYLRRGAYNTPIGSHASGAPFVRCDQALLRYAYDPGMVGKTLYLKFLSFNQYGGGKQQLADVSAYQYTIGGSISRPDPVTGVNATGQPHGILLAWIGSSADSTNRDAEFEIRQGTNWDTATLVTRVKATSYLLGVQPAGTYTYLVKAIDISGNYTNTAASVTYTVAGPGQVTPSGSITGTDCILSWPAPQSTFVIDHYEIRTGSTWGNGTLLTTIKGTSLKTPATWQNNQTFWVAATDAAGNQGAAGSCTVGVSLPAAPTVSATIAGDTATLSWNDVASSLPVASYEVRRGGSSWATATSLAQVSADSYSFKPDWSGQQVFWVAATDSHGNQGAPGSFNLTITPPKAPTITQQVIDNYVLLTWTDATQTLPIDSYQVLKGATFASAVPIGKLSGHFSTIFENQSGNYTYWVVGIDTAGNQGSPASCTATVNQPPDYVLYYNFDSQFVNGPANALNGADMAPDAQLNGDVFTKTANTNTYSSIRADNGYASGKWYWEVTLLKVGNPADTLIGVMAASSPVTNYPGSDANGYSYYADSGLKYTSGSGTSYTSATASIGDTIGVALDMDAGTLSFYKNGQPLGQAFSGLIGKILFPAIGLRWSGESASFNFGDQPFAFEPPDGFVGRASMVTDGKNLLAPVDRSTTIQTHFDNHTWSTLQDQVNAGFSIVGEPAAGSATYTELIDYGSELPATNITVTLNSQTIAGNPGIACQISVKLNATDAWTDYPNTWQVYVSNFRYVKVVLTVTSSAGADLLSIHGINTRMNVKLRNDAGNGSAAATDVNGTQVNFNYAFLDVTSITVSPSGSSAAFATYAFTDVPNPTGFQVFLWDKNGNRVSGGFSWNAKGV